jgi:hypothetical protein
MWLRVALLAYSSALAITDTGAPRPDWSTPRQMPSPALLRRLRMAWMS